MLHTVLDPSRPAGSSTARAASSAAGLCGTHCHQPITPQGNLIQHSDMQGTDGIACSRDTRDALQE